MMNKILSLAVLGFVGIASAFNCIDAVRLVNITEQMLFSLDESVRLDSNKSVNRDGVSGTTYNFLWNGPYLESYRGIRILSDGSSAMSSVVPFYVEKESELKKTGFEILLSKELNGDTTVVNHTRYTDGKSFVNSRGLFFGENLVIEFLPDESASSLFDREELITRNDTLFTRKWTKNSSGDLYVQTEFILAVDKNDSTLCNQWVVLATGDTVQDRKGEFKKIENGYSLFLTDVDENSKALQQYFFTVLKDDSSVENPDTSAAEIPDTTVVELPKDSVVSPVDSVETSKDTTLAIVKQMRAVPVLKPRDHYIDLKGRRFSKQKKELPYRVLF